MTTSRLIMFGPDIIKAIKNMKKKGKERKYYTKIGL